MRWLGWFLVAWGASTALAFGVFGWYLLGREAAPSASYEIELLAGAGPTFFVVGSVAGLVLLLGGALALRSDGR